MPLADNALCLICGIFAGVGYSVFLNIGQQTVGAGAASFLVKTESIWMALFAIALLKERLSRSGWAGILICVVGVSLIAAAQPGGMRFGAGATFVLLAAMCSALGFTLQRGLTKRHGATYVASATFIVSAIALAPWVPQAITELLGSSAETILAVLFLAVFPTTIGLFCWVYALGHFGVARSGSFLYLIAPLAMITAWVVVGEKPGPLTMIGSVLILTGVIVVNFTGRRKSSKLPSTEV